MLFIDLLTISLIFLGYVGVAWALRKQYLLEHKVSNALRYVTEENKRSVSLRKMAEVESSLTDLTDAYDALMASHKKLRSRIGMRELREKRKDDEVPDPKDDPEGFKREMRLRLHTGKLTK